MAPKTPATKKADTARAKMTWRVAIVCLALQILSLFSDLVSKIEFSESEVMVAVLAFRTQID